MCLADPKTAKFPEVIFAIVLFIVSFVEFIFVLEGFESSQREIITKWFSFQQKFNLEINQMRFQEFHQFFRFPIHRPALHHFLYTFIARYTFVARSSLWLRFTSCFNWSMISLDDWTRRSSKPNGSKFYKPIKHFDIASVTPAAFHPFAITVLLSLDVIWLYVSMNQLARNALKHVYTINVTKRWFYVSFSSDYCTAALLWQEHTKQIGKKMNFAKQILAIEPILINSAEFNFAIWGKNWEKNSPVKLLLENLCPQTFQL